MPPISGIAGAALSSLMSAIIASVVTIKPAMDAAACSAERVTLQVQNTHSNHVAVLARCRVVTEVTFALLNFINHHTWLITALATI